MLDAKQRVRYARHRSLVELGDEGVLALLRGSRGVALADARAESVRADYLARAGVPDVADEGASAAPRELDVDSFAGASYLEEAAAVCLGALHAVARIRVVAGLAREEIVPTFRLREETPGRSL